MFLTGEFSKIARVSKRMLQHYDRIDLFKPEFTDPQTGYRYYSAKQLPQLNRIIALKDMGLTLEQIRRMLHDNVSDDELYGMFLMQKAQLEREIVDAMERFRSIEIRLQQLRTHKTQPDIVMKSVPVLSYLSLREICTSPQHGWETIQHLQQALPEKVGRRSLGSLLAMINAPMFEPDDIRLEIGYVLNEPVDDPVRLSEEFVLTTRELAGVETMATLVTVGDPNQGSIMSGYGALADWVEQNQYHLAGPQREVFLSLPPTAPPHQVVVEVQFPLEKHMPSLNLLPTTDD